MEIVKNTFAELYKEALNAVVKSSDYSSIPRGQAIKEILGMKLVLTDPTSNIFTNDIRSVISNYLAGELQWYFSGSNKLEHIAEYSKFWTKLANADKTLNSAYGYQIFVDKNEHGLTEWEWVKQSIINDPDTRQACFKINKPAHSFIGNKDYPCTMFGQFFVRDNELSLHITMRSNDIIKGLTYDLPFFTLLMRQLQLELREQSKFKYLELGNYIHNVNSFHLYTKDSGLAEKMLTKEFIPSSLPIMEGPIPVGPNLLDKTFLEKSSNSLLQWIYKNITTS